MKKKQVVFISGGSSGIGRKLAQYFSQDNYLVAITARRLEELQITKKNSKNPQNILPIQGDVKDKSSIQNAIRKCQETLGEIDILVANAGISLASYANEFNSEIFEDVIKTNLMGVIYCFEAVIPSMIKNKAGQLVAISSLAAYRGLPGSSAYCASKAAVSSLTESFRLDLKKYNIRVTLIHPGFIKTPLTDKNCYKMPFLLSSDVGAKKIYQAIKAKKAIYSFPWPLATLVRLARLVPVVIYDNIISKYKNIKI